MELLQGLLKKMKSKIFLISLAISFFLNFLFFYVFRVDFPEEVNITESEVYLIDEPNSGVIKRGSAKVSMKNNRDFFSLPGIYQKIPSKKMRYSVKTFSKEREEQPYNPLNKLKKMEFEEKDIKTPVIKQKEHIILKKSVAKLIGDFLKSKKQEDKVFKITGNIRTIIDEGKLKKELEGINENINGEFNVYLRFFTKDTYSLEIAEKKNYSKVYVEKLKKILRNCIKMSNEYYISKKYSGKIYLMRTL